MQAIILGCGPSSGVPSIGRGWGACSPSNLKNYRTRTSLFFKTSKNSWLIDASPDLRFQCLTYDICSIDGVLCTHSHMDHVGGIGDLIGFSSFGPIPFYADSFACKELETMLPYACLGKSRFIQLCQILGLFYLSDIPVIAFLQKHGATHSLGYRFPTWAYSTDLTELSEESFEILKGIDTWILGCLSSKPNTKHAHLEQVLDWVKRVNPKRTILTHMNADLDYETLKKQLPYGIEPAFDGMSIFL
ncbi:MBL fold metallo-hydrolase [Holospora undulata]|uniref:MBL fold metallo-hydrolase n=1 Tax=Holospora undulata TaxID=1169117 RepID=UPI0003A5F297|nr:MBL fold metallo-hydrolase [Holospora undulata]